MAMPETMPDIDVTAISPNGRSVLSELYQTLTSIDLETGDRTTFSDDGSQTLSYCAGTGNCVANDGSFLGNYSAMSPACLFKNGKYTMLPTRQRDLPGSANGITPDGRFICGTQHNRGVSEMDDAILSVPCVWEMNESGSYGLPVMLPHPELDFTGRPPVYVTAVRISDDGSRIVGQVYDFGGAMRQPIVYDRAADGTWSYTLIHPELINPGNVEFPAYPGEGPEAPNITDFMTAEEKSEYDLAVKEWEENCAITGNYDYSTYPVEEDFMSDDSLDKYDVAKAAYDRLAEEWSADFMAFINAYNQCINDGCAFVFNNIFLSSDGKTMAMTNRKNAGSYEEGNLVSYDTPYIFNLETGAVTHNPNERNSLIDAMADDGTLFTHNANYYYDNADVRLPDGTLVSLQDYMNTASPVIANWMKENMYHDMEVWNYATMTWEMKENVPCYGRATCTPDLKTIATTVSNEWDETAGVSYYSYILDVETSNGIDAVQAGADASITCLSGGVIRINGALAALEVYDMQGRKVFEQQGAEGVVNTGLNGGIYLLKARTAEGKTIGLKAAF